MKWCGFLLLMILSSCGIRQTFDSMEYNRQAIDESTATIYGNIQTIQAANRSIEENRRQLMEINKELKKASEGG